jgi:hypothetical protein
MAGQILQATALYPQRKITPQRMFLLYALSYGSYPSRHDQNQPPLAPSQPPKTSAAKITAKLE